MAQSPSMRAGVGVVSDRVDIFMYATAAVCMLFLFVKAKEAASTNTATEGALAAERSMP